MSSEQPATLSEVSEAQPERMALNASSVSKGRSETSSAVAVISVDRFETPWVSRTEVTTLLSPSAPLDDAIRTLPWPTTKPKTDRATPKIKRRLSLRMHRRDDSSRKLASPGEVKVDETQGSPLEVHKDVLHRPP